MRFDYRSDRTMLQIARRQPTAPHVRRPWLQLLTAVMDLAGGKAELLRHAETPWASVTFSGSRHRLALAFAGNEAVNAGEEFIAALPEHEFTVARQIVADAAVLSAEHVLVPEPKLTVEIELLLLEDGVDVCSAFHHMQASCRLNSKVTGSNEHSSYRRGRLHRQPHRGRTRRGWP